MGKDSKLETASNTHLVLVHVAKSSFYFQKNMSEKSWNQIEEYVWKWYPILIGVASIGEENKKVFTT